MNKRICRGVLIVGGLIAAALPSNLSVAQSKDSGPFASASVTATVHSPKDRYWRHRGGRHPHYGSRRVRTEPALSGN